MTKAAMSFLLMLVFCDVRLITGMLVRNAECGISLGCMYDCVDNYCSYIIYWKYRPEFDSVEISMNKHITDIYQEQWLALGFSHDRSMGDDSVIECTMDHSWFHLADVRHSYNNKHYNQPVYYAKTGLRSVIGRVTDGVLTCNFTRTITLNGDDRIFDLDRSWYLLVASGMMVQVSKSMHDREPSVSPYKVDLREHIDVNGDPVYYLVKLHGCLMVFSWMMVASVGVVVARYFKQAWPHGKMCGNSKWYQAHRLMMGTVVLCVSASFIIIWYDTGEYSKLTGASTFQRAHPVLGVVIMGLTILNPIIAFIRPASGTVSRPVFKYAHGFIGTTVYLLALLNIALGTTLEKSATSKHVVWVVVSFGIYQFLFEVILEIHNGYLIKTGQRAAYEMKQTTPIEDSLSSFKQEPPGIVFKKAFLAFHVVAVLGVGTTCIFLVAM